VMHDGTDKRQPVCKLHARRLLVPTEAAAELQSEAAGLASPPGGLPSPSSEAVSPKPTASSSTPAGRQGWPAAMSSLDAAPPGAYGQPLPLHAAAPGYPSAVANPGQLQSDPFPASLATHQTPSPAKATIHEYAAVTAANFAAAAAAAAASGPSDAELLALLQLRHQARKARDFATSDLLREQLHHLGVYPDDKQRVWRASDGRVGSLDGPDYLGPPPGHAGASAVGAAPQAPSVSVAPPAATPYASTELIHEKLAEREQARMGKDFARADEVRRELNAYGVTVDDRGKTWRCVDGRGGPRPDARGALPPVSIAGVQAWSAAHSQAEPSGAFAGYGSQAAGDAAHRERSRSPPRSAGAYPSAYAPSSYNGGQTAPATSAPQAAGMAPSPYDEEARLLDLLQRRYNARLVRDYPTSDALRSELNAMGVMTDDRAKTWRRSRDGRVGQLEGPDFLSPPAGLGASSYSNPPAVGAYAFPTSYMSEADINAQLTAREVARMAKDFTTADTIRSTLNAAGVTVCDRTKTWSARDGRRGARPDARGNVTAVDPYTAAAATVAATSSDPNAYGGYATQYVWDPQMGSYTVQHAHQ